MDTNIYHDNITAKTQLTTNTKALIYLGAHGSVAERIKHEVSGMPTFREKSSNAVRGRFFIA